MTCLSDTVRYLETLRWQVLFIVLIALCLYCANKDNIVNYRHNGDDLDNHGAT